MSVTEKEKEKIRKEIVDGGVDFTGTPQTEEERIKYFLDKIFKIRKRRLMNFDDLITRLQKLDADIAVARKCLEGASGKLEIVKWTAVIKSFSTQKLLCSERRYVIQRLHMDINELEKELLKVTR